MIEEFDDATLPFRRIADLWAKEISASGYSADPSDRLVRLISGMWAGQFESAQGSTLSLEIEGATQTNDDGTKQLYNGPISFDRRELLEAALDFSPSTFQQQKFSELPEPPSRLVKRKLVLAWLGQNADAWYSALASIRNVDEYEWLFRTAHLEDLTISREPFLTWCDRHNFTRPLFWVQRVDEAASDSEIVKTGAPGASPLVSTERIEQEFQRRVNDGELDLGKVSSARTATARSLIQWHHQKYPGQSCATEKTIYNNLPNFRDNYQTAYPSPETADPN